MTLARYRSICALVGPALDHPLPVVHDPGALCAWPVGIYALGHRHPTTGQFVIDYVGSAVRRGGDVAHRIRDHLRVPDRRARFTGQVVVPLKAHLSTCEVRRLEGIVTRALGTPLWCSSVPGGRADI
jgi:hypothetical protein